MFHTGLVLRVAAAVAVVVAALAIGAHGAEPQRQHQVVAASHGRTVEATLGTHCAPSNGGVACAEHSYPLRTKKRLPMHAGGRIELRFRVKPEEIDPQLRDRRSRSVYELKARGGGRLRTIRLPRTLPKGSDRLGFFVRYERGDADFEVDLKRHRHR
jgi:hypothetical protein